MNYVVLNCQACPVVSYVYLQFVHGLLVEADCHEEVDNGGKLVQVEVIATRQISQAAVEAG